MKKIIALCLVSLMLLSVLAACGGETTPPASVTTASPVDTTAPTESGDASTEPTETEYPAPQIAAVDYSGKSIRILANEPVTTSFNYSEIEYTDEMGDVVNDAIFKRNAQITEKYKITIETTYASTGGGPAALTKAINAGNDDFHFASIRIRDIMSHAAQGLMTNIDDAAPIDLDAPWYYQQLQDALSIGGEDYMLTGYLNMRIFDSAPALYYNKAVVDKHQLENFYDLVFSGDWTLDKFFEICAKVGNDVNNDGKIDITDEVGLTAHPGGILNFVVGANADFVTKDANDIPVYSGITERNEAVLNKILTNLYTAPASLHMEYAQFNGQFTTGFNENRSLFLLNCLYEMQFLAANGTDFGVLPLPKADKAQEGYRIHTHSSLGTAIGIPFNNTELDMTAKILEDMMYLSYKYIYPAHIEKTMQLRYATDEESTEILKLMFNSLCIEMSTALGLTCDSHLRTLGNIHSTGIVPVFKTTFNQNTASVDKYVSGFTE